MVSKKSKLIGFLFFSILILFDQLLKYIIRSKSGFYICNPNLAFGLSKYFIVLFIFLIFILSLLFLITNKNPAYKIKTFIGNLNGYIFLSILLIFSGGISNIIDRLNFGCVIDFIKLPFWPVFNPADIYISLGFIILIIKTAHKPNNNN